jgi:hypothetical protein
MKCLAKLNNRIMSTSTVQNINFIAVKKAHLYRVKLFEMKRKIPFSKFNQTTYKMTAKNK